jgi:alpha-L-fucosidase
VRLLSPAQMNLLRAFDAQTEGKGLRFTDGKAPHAYVYEWNSTAQAVLWPARIAQAAEFGVWVQYSTATPASGGRFAVEIGGQRVEGSVAPTPKDTQPREVNVGTVKLPAGEATVRVRAIAIEGGELMRLFSVTLRP